MAQSSDPTLVTVLKMLVKHEGLFSSLAQSACDTAELFNTMLPKCRCCEANAATVSWNGSVWCDRCAAEMVVASASKEDNVFKDLPVAEAIRRVSTMVDTLKKHDGPPVAEMH